MEGGGRGNNVTYLSSLPVSVRMYFLLNKDALGNACHNAQVNPNSIVILFVQGGYMAFLVLPSNVFFDSVSTKEEKLSTVCTRRTEEAS